MFSGKMLGVFKVVLALVALCAAVESVSITPELENGRSLTSEVSEANLQERRMRFIEPPPAIPNRGAAQESGAGKINFPGEQQVAVPVGFVPFIPPPSGVPPVDNGASIFAKISAIDSSRLFIQPGSQGTVILQVKNVGSLSSQFTFSAGSNINGFVGLSVQPAAATLSVGQQIEVRLVLSVPLSVNPGTVVILNFFVNRQIDGAYITRQILVQTRNEPYDTSLPFLRLITATRCGDYLNTNCGGRYWTAILDVGDSESGMRSLETLPETRFNGENFPIGSNASVIMEYVSSCCQSKVEVVATDLRGNRQSLIVDQYTIDNIRLGSGDIAAITLGVLILIVLIIVIVIWICRCRKRRSIKAVLKTSRATDK